MKKYAVVFEFDESEIGGLLKSLEHSGFMVLEGTYDRHIYHSSATDDTAVGNAEKNFDGIHLYIFEGVENNPLHGFLERFSSSEDPSANSGKDDRLLTPLPHA